MEPESPSISMIRKLAKFVSIPISLGIVDVQLFSVRWSLVNNVKRPISLGIDPESEFFSNLSVVKLVRSPISVGTVPANFGLLAFRRN